MKIGRARIRTRSLMTAWMLVAMYVASARAATIAGVVRDAAGGPLNGAQIKLTTEAGVMKEQATTGKDGVYRFEQIVPGTYNLAADLAGFSPSAAMVTVSAASASVVADLLLKPLPQDANAAQTPHPPPPKFEAAGVRGLIDPGGYSAPANAAAASGLISGIADIKRVDNTSAMAKDMPCGLEPELRNAVDANPQQAAANRRLGEFYLAHAQPQQAILYLKRAREIDKSDPTIARDFAEALLANGEFNAARDLLAATPASQMDADMHRLLARADEGLGRFTDASKQYQIAAQSDPSEQNLFGAGYELILAGLPADAAKAFAAGIANYPHSVTLLVGAGTAEFLQGKSSDAVTLFLQATDAEPSDPRPYSFLTAAYGISGAQTEKVRASLKRHLDLAPNDAKAYYFYALGLSRQEKDSAATDKSRVEALLQQAIVLDPRLADAHFRLGILYAERDDDDDAAREFEATLRLQPDLKEAHYRLAAAYRKTGRVAQAAHEMQLFSEARDAQSRDATRDGGISIEQFISVVDRPGPASGQAQCPEVPR